MQVDGLTWPWAMSVDFVDVLAAHKGPFLAAMEIFPLVGGALLQAILVESVWLSSIPERESPKTTICPLPSALLFSASASQIEILYSAFFHLCAQKGVEMLRIHRGQMAAFFHAELFGSNPVFFVGTKKETAVLIERPVSFTGALCAVTVSFHLHVEFFKLGTYSDISI